MIYLDNAATTMTAPEVVEAMLRYFGLDYANPSGTSTPSARARRAVEEARESVAELIGAEPDEIYFTSGGTESNNTALFGAVSGVRDAVAVCSAIEHPSVLRSLEQLEKQGTKLIRIPCPGGHVDPESLYRSMRTVFGASREDSIYNTSSGHDRGVLSVMLVNNELGTVQPVKELAKTAHESGLLFHTDAVQAAGHIPVDVKDIDADMLSLSAHKFHGPKGVGALFVKRGVRIPSLLYGGGQENGLRSGTLNVPAIAGMGKAAKLAEKNMENDAGHMIGLKELMVRELKKNDCRFVINGNAPEYCNTGSSCVLQDITLRTAPSILNIAFEGVEASSLLLELDMKGIICSAGSACAASGKEPSHVLTVAGIEPELIKGSLRISFSRYNTEEEVIKAASVMAGIVKRLRLLCV